MVIIDRNNAHHGERDGRFAVKPKSAGNAARLGADVEPADETSEHMTPATVRDGDVWRGRTVRASSAQPGYLEVSPQYADRHARSYIHAASVVPASARLSDYTQIHRSCELGEEVQTVGGVSIEERGRIGQCSTLNTAELSEGVTLGSYVRIGGMDTDSMIPSGPICVIGRETTIGDRSRVFAGSQLGERTTIGDDVTLFNADTGSDVTIGHSSQLSNVTVPNGAHIGANADIEGPQHLITISMEDKDRERPTVVAYRTFSYWERDETVCSARVTAQTREGTFEIDLDDAEGIDHLVDTLSVHSDPELYRDSADGRQEGIVSILENPERLQALRERVGAWFTPRWSTQRAPGITSRGTDMYPEPLDS